MQYIVTSFTIKRVYFKNHCNSNIFFPSFASFFLLQMLAYQDQIKRLQEKSQLRPVSQFIPMNGRDEPCCYPEERPHRHMRVSVFLVLFCFRNCLFVFVLFCLFVCLFCYCCLVVCFGLFVLVFLFVCFLFSFRYDFNIRIGVVQNSMGE